MYDCYDGLIFDMDGTIIDTEQAHNQAWRQVLAPLGIQFDQQAMAAIAVLNGYPTWRIARALTERYQINADPCQLAAEKTAVVQEILLDTIKPLPVVDVVRTYYGRKAMAIGTGSEHAMAETLLRHLGLRHYFNAVVGADDVKKHKPEPDTFLRCAKLINVLPKKCVVFEDADFGIEAARRANMAYVDVRTL